MKAMNRREALGALSAFALTAPLSQAQTTAASTVETVKLFKYAEFPLVHNPNGSTGRNVPQELIPPGDVMGIHLTTIEPGKEYGPMRKSTICEIRMIHSGTMELLVEGQPSQTAEAGDIIVASANQTYHVRNPGSTPLTYLILQIKPKT